MKDGHLKDGTARSRSGGTGGAVAGVDRKDLERGYATVGVEKTPTFASDDDGGTNSVGDPLKRGGFAGRPMGWAR